MSKQKQNDDFGQRMKSYEVLAEQYLDLSRPVIARIDGRAFSTFTRGMNKPFDPVITLNMIETTKYLLRKMHAKIGYTQSDEITLVFGDEVVADLLAGQPIAPLPFDGRIQKLASVLASMTASRFMWGLETLTLQAQCPHFDARVFNVPSRIEAANNILWRAMDAKKNAIQAVARVNFSHKELHNKGQIDMIEMLKVKGISMDQYASTSRYGAFIQKRNIQRHLTNEELQRIPEKFRPTEEVVRSEYKVIEMPPFNTVKNRVEVIFESAEPTV